MRAVKGRTLHTHRTGIRDMLGFYRICHVPPIGKASHLALSAGGALRADHAGSVGNTREPAGIEKGSLLHCGECCTARTGRGAWAPRGDRCGNGMSFPRRQGVEPTKVGFAVPGRSFNCRPDAVAATRLRPGIPGIPLARSASSCYDVNGSIEVMVEMRSALILSGRRTVQARDVMTIDVVSLSPDTPISEIARLFRTLGITGAPVLESGRIIGIVTEIDLIARHAKLHTPYYLPLLDAKIPLGGQREYRELVRRILGGTARDIMTVPVNTIAPDADIEEVATLMVESRANPIPVVEDGRLVGIIGHTDLIRHLETAPAQGEGLQNDAEV